MQILKFEEEKRHWQRIFTEALKEDTVIDVGTGPGIVALLFSELGQNVTGVDYSEGMPRNVLKNKEALGLPVNFRIGDAKKLPFAHNSFASNPAIRKKVS